MEEGRVEKALNYIRTMSLTNFQLNANFKWLLLIPSLLWGIGLVFPTVLSRRDG